MIGSIGSGASLQVSHEAVAKQSSRMATAAVGETVSPFEIAQQIQDVQVKNLERHLDAQSLVLDLLA